MTRDEAIRHLYTYSSTNGSGQTKQEQHEEAKRIAIEALQQPERKTGKWLPDKHDMAGYGYFDCSECGANFYDVYDFCPNCGADMREQP